MSNPLVSVIIPVYNVEKYLRECLDSVANQTLKDIEIICVDDGSTDGSMKILEEFKEKDSRFTILTQRNLRAGVARNNGLRYAKGEYLSFLDSDDIFDLNMLEEMYNTAVKDKSEIVTCSFYTYDDRTKKYEWINKTNKRFVNMSPFSPHAIRDYIFNFSTPNAWTKLFKRSLFDNYHLHFEPTFCCNDVTCVDTALALAKKISVIDKPFVYYRINQNNNLTSGRSRSAESFLFAAQQLEKNLKRFNVYESFKTSFANKMRSSYNWELSLCTPEQKEERKRLAKKILSPNLYSILYIKNKPKYRFTY